MNTLESVGARDFYIKESENYIKHVELSFMVRKHEFKMNKLDRPKQKNKHKEYKVVVSEDGLNALINRLKGLVSKKQTEYAYALLGENNSLISVIKSKEEAIEERLDLLKESIKTTVNKIEIK